jgi:hypothetical protein
MGIVMAVAFGQVENTLIRQMLFEGFPSRIERIVHDFAVRITANE